MPKPLYPHNIGFRPFTGGGITPSAYAWYANGCSQADAGATLTAVDGFGQATATHTQALDNTGTGLRGYVEFTHNSVTDYGYFGWTSAATAQSSNIKAGFYIAGAAEWRVYHNGTDTALPVGAWNGAERFRVELYDDKTIWLVNDIQAYQSATSFADALLWMGAHFYYSTCALTNVVMAGVVTVPR
ncbi:hypothetical protein LJY25_14825 [Hymenobacter sp. BT175]|uniref:hypothetical protein n=1 Tax=Hymenobacter translucens TaxID=2886507 RepID=UPI001D0E37B9|nr:hypothetical protein [Hymenobacter translucens]MCC2547727.1 hypothetical protein [Hymenobacter translucens]